MVTGVTGLLVFIVVQEWPARVACTHCKKSRIVNRKACEHCDSAFPPAAATGTEIFEALNAGP